ncbi:hypothetical protein UFOVP1157_9 [uncultured Caudovirales phage]|uniref:Uncharacterized protein n=1 Tax=uncultured Caudovirales phage TaxID=2100421 RepID=A0A6J5QJB7_9CAUD|nr:hypothetical protein UFOVP497_26 [uncultured Caudovirales phage]CAB4164189.1 hypothetical protein UFOVP834_2 [uncultured Caudovirales phage]CAB4172352.1 hypothetical protein UFOVP922_9 [uncultured Caudovirales phage]CAB4177500.1 hypothetical protein UFOVP1006_2 [uncultured Caudovirales phage]CAB4183832.1 hypothetical protein UFOVP1096_18 [uncultured Caudovirales phage]
MAYTVDLAGGQAIATTDTVKQHQLGTIISGTDPIYGEAEFIYLLGVASTVVGSPVTFDALTYQTTLAAVGTNLPRRVAFAMSANVASSYGWYQISGMAIASKSASICCVAGAAVAVKTTGLISKTGSGKEISGALCAATASAATGRTTVLLSIDRPHLQGRIT